MSVLVLSERQLEIAARELCKLRHQDPDTPIPHGSQPNDMGFAYDVCFYSPRWQLVANQIEAHLQVMSVIDHAVNSTVSINAGATLNITG